MEPCLLVTKSSPPSGGGLRRKVNNDDLRHARNRELQVTQAPMTIHTQANRRSHNYVPERSLSRVFA